MSKYHRIFVIVIDSLGIGAMPDAERFGDAGTNTLGHISESVERFHIPHLQSLGLANLTPLRQVPALDTPKGYHAVLREKSNAKDTMTGHWEMMGLETTTPFQTFTETGFPPELIAELERRTGHKVIGNKSASGTVILDELAEEEIATGHMIVYTSADSVLQICGNEETFGLDELYRCCEIARELTLRDEWKVGRVIARPYLGRHKGEFERTSNRHDYALKPSGTTAPGWTWFPLAKSAIFSTGKGLRRRRNPGRLSTAWNRRLKPQRAIFTACALSIWSILTQSGGTAATRRATPKSWNASTKSWGFCWTRSAGMICSLSPLTTALTRPTPAPTTPAKRYLSSRGRPQWRETAGCPNRKPLR